MRRAARTDANHAQIRNAFRDLLFSVADTAALGDGFGDLVIAKNGHTAIIEVKDGAKSPSQRELTTAEMKFKACWLGDYRIVESLGDVQRVSETWPKR